MVATGWREAWAVTADVYEVSLGTDENVLELDSGNDYTTFWIY